MDAGDRGSEIANQPDISITFTDVVAVLKVSQTNE